MKHEIAPIAAIFELNTDLVLNCLDDVTDAVAARRLEGGGNSIAFLVAHLTDARFFVARLLGSTSVNPMSSILENANSIDDVGNLPPLSEMRGTWQAISSELAQRLHDATDAHLTQPTAQAYPIAGGSVKDAIAFLAQHDSYHLGQIAFLRRSFGLPAMKYARRSQVQAHTNTEHDESVRNERNAAT